MIEGQEKLWVWCKPTKEAVELESGNIFYSDLWEPYHPFDFPNLPNILAKVDNTDSAIDFVKKYGVLGYHAFFPELENKAGYGLGYVYEKGDPIDWLLAQARTVRFALHLINAINNKDEEDTKTFILNAMVQVQANMLRKEAPEGLKAKAHVFAEGSKIVFRVLIQQNIWEGKYRLLAIQIVNHLVNSNSEGVQRRLLLKGNTIPETPYKFAQQLAARSLIEAIWYMVGNAALLSQEKNGKGVRTCQECGLPFIITDKRQRFCPGDAFSKGSLCGARNRMKKHRAK